MNLCKLLVSASDVHSCFSDTTVSSTAQDNNDSVKGDGTESQSNKISSDNRK